MPNSVSVDVADWAAVQSFARFNLAGDVAQDARAFRCWHIVKGRIVGCKFHLEHIVSFHARKRRAALRRFAYLNAGRIGVQMDGGPILGPRASFTR